jgi:hypothetical protein
MGSHRLVASAFALVVLAVGLSACSSEEAAADPGTTAPTRGGPGCANGKKDDGETGVDCGGVCGKCGGDACAEVTECKSGECKDGTCTTPTGSPTVPGPTNGVKDNGESDVDCGGPNAPGCAAGKTCASEADCADKYCPEASPRVCVTPKADDGVLNGTETDIDCGGGAPTNAAKCAVGKKCLVDGDCTGACNYKKLCVEAPSCKPQFGGDTCGAGDYEEQGKEHESCCKTLPVTGFTDASYPGKQVFLDKYEITAGRVRAFIEDIAAKNGGEPNIKAWVAANQPKLWSSTFDFILPSGNELDAGVTMPHPITGSTGPSDNPANVGVFYSFNATRYTYIHGDNCFVGGTSYGFPTYHFPANVQALSGAAERAVPNDDNGALAVGAKEQLDMKSMNCIPAAVLAAFCHWDGGQLATDEVLDFVTGTPATLGFASGCTGSRCPPLAQVQATSDSGSDSGLLYYYPYYAGTSEGTSRVAAPGRVTTDVVRLNAGDDPWMDIRGNMHEIVLDVAGATFNNQFGIKYQGLGYSSARAGGNSVSPTAPALTGRYNWPEYKAAYSGGRCMRFK